MSMKALITGITGQDGYYLSKFLIEKGYQVHGTIRRASTFNTSRIDSLISKYEGTDKLNLYYSDLLDSSSLSQLVSLIQPDEIYNLAAQSHVAVSFKNPLYTSQTAVGTLTLLEAIKNSDKKIKFYQASSSEMYGGASEEELNEESLLDPKSPYAASKVFSHNINKIYRESYDLFCVNGILFNHESPHRGETFVTRKITRAVGRIKK
jgi:GDPmannose 4,6-dehydratase